MTTVSAPAPTAAQRLPAVLGGLPRGRHWRPGWASAQLGVFVVAVIARVSVVLRHGGLHGNYGYDAGVYFAAADAFVHGRLPYRDFVLIHPPVQMLVLSPFAALTHLTTDEAAFTATVLAFTVLGGVNALLVLRVARSLGLGHRRAALAALFYAVWFGAIGSEYLIKLEPVGNTLFLLGLLAVLRARDRASTRWAVVAGAAAGATVSVKIWWIVPVLALLVWTWRAVSPRAAGYALTGAVVVSVVVDGPFFVASPRAMWSSVVTDQVSRGSISGSPLTRLADLSSITHLTGPLPLPGQAVAGLAVLVAAAWVGRRAWTVPVARPVVVLCAIQGLLLLAAPSWFSYYSDFLAVPAALCVGAAAGSGPRRRSWRPAAGWVVTGVMACVTVAAVASGRTAVRPFSGAAVLARGAASARCVLSDSPMGLIELNALSRSFTDGCRNWVDVTGRTYGPDRGAGRRIDNLRWQRDLLAYLRSGDAVIVVRGSGTGVSAQTYRALHRDGVLARAGGHTLYRVRP